jgi:tetratricopeptide (TPR) repeat protein
MPAVQVWCDLALKAAQELADWGLDPEPVAGLAPPEELAWQVRELKGDAFYFEADWLEAREQYTLLLERLPATPTDAITLNRTAEMMRKIGETWRGEGNQAEALDQFRQALALLELNPLATCAQIAILHREIGYVLAQEREAGLSEEAQKHYLIALELVDDDPEQWALVASLYTCLGSVFEQAVEPEEGEEPTPEQRETLSKALDWHTRAIESRGKPLSPESDLARDRLGLAGALSNRAIVYEKLREWGRCEADHLEAIQLLTEIGHEVRIAMARLNYGEMLRQQGRHSEAAEQYRGSLMAFIRVGDRFGEMIDHFNLSLVEASESLRRAHAFRAASIAALDERWWWLEFIASAYLDAHDEGMEREDARRKLERFLTDPSSSWTFPESMVTLLAPTADDDHRKLGTLAQDSERSSEIGAAITRAGALRQQ